MKKRILIDASHAEETRVAFLESKHLENFEYESRHNQSCKGNIYLGVISRVEPSLQAVFVSFGGERDGFLSFEQIHPDYYRIPVEDRKKLLEDISQHAACDDDTTEDSTEDPIQRLTLSKNYKVQEVIQKKQLLLVQVTKDERGNKGAALTTYLSLAGRHCVLLPNTPRGIGISRKISSHKERTRLRDIMTALKLPSSMGAILRTAITGCSKDDIAHDYFYLQNLWTKIRKKTITSQAPTCIYEAGNIIKKVIRDLFTKDIDQILIHGKKAYEQAVAIARQIMPDYASRIEHAPDTSISIFDNNLEKKIDAIGQPSVSLPSGGYIVFGTTEALTTIDVNSGRATKERHINETAVKTNLEAAEEIARQLRLRDLGGLIVIDFIDMSHQSHKVRVEKCLERALQKDKARTQTLGISDLGLLELSRQRLKPSLDEAMRLSCPHCHGIGTVPSLFSAALRALRQYEQSIQDIRHPKKNKIVLHVSQEIATYLLTHKSEAITNIHHRHHIQKQIVVDAKATSTFYAVEETPQELTDNDLLHNQHTQISLDKNETQITDIHISNNEIGIQSNTQKEHVDNSAVATHSSSVILAYRGLHNTRLPTKNPGQVFKKKFTPLQRPMLCRDPSYKDHIMPKPTQLPVTEKKKNDKTQKKMPPKPICDTFPHKNNLTNKVHKHITEKSKPLNPPQEAIVKPIKSWWRRLLNA